MEVLGHVGGHKAEILIDHGAKGNIVSEAFLRKTRLRTAKRPVPMTVIYADGRKDETTRWAPNVPITVKEYNDRIAFDVAPIAYDVILGTKWLDALQAVTKNPEDTITIQHQGNEIVLRSKNKEKENTTREREGSVKVTTARKFRKMQQKGEEVMMLNIQPIV